LIRKANVAAGQEKVENPASNAHIGYPTNRTQEGLMESGVGTVTCMNMVCA
jgi:hypothetical protein